MTRSTRVLSALLGVLALSIPLGCSLFGSEPQTLDDLRVYIGTRVADPERASAMQAEVERAKTRLDEFNRALRELGSEMRAANARYDASRDRIDQLFQRHNRLRAQVQDDLLDGMLAVRDLATDDEWGDIVELSLNTYRKQLAQAGRVHSVTATEGRDG